MFQASEPIGITKPYALFVGTLEPRKNLGNLIKAYSLLPASTRSGCDLVIVGGKGWKQTGLANEVRGGLETNIKFTDSSTTARSPLCTRIVFFLRCHLYMRGSAFRSSRHSLSASRY